MIAHIDRRHHQRPGKRHPLRCYHPNHFHHRGRPERQMSLSRHNDNRRYRQRIHLGPLVAKLLKKIWKNLCHPNQHLRQDLLLLMI